MKAKKKQEKRPDVDMISNVSYDICEMDDNIFIWFPLRQPDQDIWPFDFYIGVLIRSVYFVFNILEINM